MASLDVQGGPSCPQCGAPVYAGCEHNRSTQELSSKEESGRLTKEKLLDMQNLEIELKADFSAVIESLKQKTGADLQARPEGFHITVVGPTEKDVLKTLTDDQIEELQTINSRIQSGEGVEIKGIGFIDGSNQEKYKMRDSDKDKKTAFLALDIPALQEFRAKIGLPPKYFHATLGFESGDIHFQVVGQEEFKPGKFKDKTAPIPKEADGSFDEFFATLPEINYGGLSGQIKERKEIEPVKQPEAKKEKKDTNKEYNVEKFRSLLIGLIESGKSGGISMKDVDKIVGIVTSDPSSLGKELRGDFRFIKDILQESEK